YLISKPSLAWVDDMRCEYRHSWICYLCTSRWSAVLFMLRPHLQNTKTVGIGGILYLHGPCSQCHRIS
ncbi:hypothetical protein MKW98_017441, partial [Papaver atlanticum]